MSGVPQGGNVWKNIIIGVLTTVVAYLIVHFIFDKKDSSKLRKEKKEKIETAWNSVNGYINSARKKFTTIGCYSCDEDQMKKELLRELDKMNQSLQNIHDDPQLDEKMKSIIDITTQMFRDEKPILANYYDSLKLVKELPDSMKNKTIMQLQKSLMKQMVYVQNFDSTEFSEYLADLNKRYKTKLVKKDIALEIIPEELPGTWKVECTYTMNFKKDHTFKVEFADQKASGKWNLYKNFLHISYSDGSIDNFVVIQLDNKMMILVNNDTEILLGACKQ